jgi:hypothetical protein
LSASKSTASQLTFACVCRVSAEEAQSPLNVYDTVNGDGVHLLDNCLLSIDYLRLYLSMYIIIHCRILTIRRVHIMSEGSPYGSLMEITRNSFNCDSL